MTMQTTTPTPEQVRDAWDSIATGFDQYGTPLTLRLGEEALELVDLRRGMRFLDVAAGTGALSIPAARLGARVVATDIAPGMIEHLNERARDEGLSNLEGRVMDGCALDLEDDSFDVSGSQNGVSLFPDLEQGLREMVRVTRPGGRVVIVTFGPFPKVEFLTFFMGAMKASIPGFTGLPSDPPPLPFRLADPRKLRQEMSGVGLGNVRVETVSWSTEFQSAGHLWDMATNTNPIGAKLVADLTEDQKDDVQRVLEGMLRERSGGGPAAILSNEVNVGIGTK